MIFTIAFLCALSAPSTALPQDPRPEQTPPKPVEPEKEPRHLPPMPGTSPEDALKKELQELFVKVESRLKAIDTQMYEAAAGRVPTKPITGSGIEELLRLGQQAKAPENVGELLQSAAQDSQRTQMDIQRMLEIAQKLNKKPGSGQPGGQSQPKPGDGKSPLDKQGMQPGGREETPKAPGSNPQGEKPKDGEQPKDGKQPDDPNRPTTSQQGQEPPPVATGPQSTAQGADRWGDLPVRAREIFRVEGASDLPPQYRDWIDGYYRRLQSLERR